MFIERRLAILLGYYIVRVQVVLKNLHIVYFPHLMSTFILLQNW